MVWKLRKRSCSLINLKKLVYLISPQKIDSGFYNNLNKVLSANNVKFFQLRLKRLKKNKIVKIAKKIRNITKKYKVKMIINDDPIISKLSNADGCHLGQSDGSVLNAKKYLKKKIIGVTCHSSRSLARIAVKNEVDYLAFGSFHKSKLKPFAKKANLSILIWAKKNIRIPIVAIGGN